MNVCIHLDNSGVGGVRVYAVDSLSEAPHPAQNVAGPNGTVRNFTECQHSSGGNSCG